MTVPTVRRGPATPPPPALLDVAAETLVADPSASLASVAAAAGIGRTTLHKKYATRQDLLVAVAHRSLDLAERAVRIPDAAAPDAPDRLIAALIPVGPQLAFLFRQPSLDANAEVAARLSGLDGPIIDVVTAAQEAGRLRGDRPVWWFVCSLYALVYVAWEGIASGRLARLEAPALVRDTLLHGLGAW